MGQHTDRIFGAKPGSLIQPSVIPSTSDEHPVWRGHRKEGRLRSRDCSRLLASELDVKVSLHPAQASRRPCDGPVSSPTTCWLYDTEPKSMPLRGREHQWNQATAMCNTFSIDSSVVLVPRHRREVCPLARRVMWPRPRAQPVSTPLQGGLRFFPPLYPHCRWLA